MSAGQVAIVNRALARLGLRTLISSMDEESAEAAAGRQFYAVCLDETLALLDWRFASKVAALPLSGVAPLPWRYQAVLPADCLTPRDVRNALVTVEGAWPWDGGYADWWIAGRYAFAVGAGVDSAANPVRALWCNLETPLLRYTARIDDPALWEPTFASALAFTLAAEFALPLTGKVEMRTAMAQARAMELAQAASNTAQGYPRATGTMIEAISARF